MFLFCLTNRDEKHINFTSKVRIKNKSHPVEDEDQKVEEKGVTIFT